MDSHQLIDAQFDRAVEIVQSFSKTGPIETGYEEKLTMYSLYKQATVGNVQGPRPSVWDMLGRAKWDAWAKHKDLDQHEAKWLYVDALLKVLRKYSDKTVAMDLVRELESYNGDVSNLVLSRSMSRSSSSSSSGSGSSEAGPSGSHYLAEVPAHLLNNQDNTHVLSRDMHPGSKDDISGDEHGEVDQMPPPTNVPSAYAPSHLNRPHSSTSMRRYRTPMASMLMSPPPVSLSVPPAQPIPTYETPSAYAGHVSVSGPESPPYPYTADYPRLSRTNLTSSPPGQFAMQPSYRSASRQNFSRPFPLQQPPPERHALDRNSIQMQLRVLQERLERLEFAMPRSTTSLLSNNRGRSPRGSMSPLGSPDGPWDPEHMGMWAIVLNPLASLTARFRQLADFLAYNPDRSPSLLIIRRLFLDITFLMCLLLILKMSWRRSGVRRQEVVHALKGVWWAVVGRKRPRSLVDKAI